MLTKEQLAEMLDDRSYGDELTVKEEIDAMDAGLLVVFGASDDLLELRGAIRDEVGAYDGTTIQVDEHGVKPTWDDGDEKDYDEAAEFFARKNNPSIEIEAVWCDDGNSEGHAWTIKTDVPHAKFTIMDDGEKFCRGVVIHLESALREKGNE